MINKFIKILGLSIIVLGFLLSIASLMYNRYANENEFQEKLLALDEISSNNSEKYFKLREEYLTPKFVLENYGITSIIVGSIILVIYLYASKVLIINLLNNNFVSFYFLLDNNNFFLSK
ncbi:MAG: hypothetical protein WC679_09515 [Bacteroidales bacterium]|jgi:hypothetical protein